MDEDGEFPNLVVSNLVVCNSYAEALFCALAFDEHSQQKL